MSSSLLQLLSPVERMAIYFGRLNWFRFYLVPNGYDMGYEQHLTGLGYFVVQFA